MERLTDFEGIVLAALRFNLAATAEGIAEALGVPKDRVQRVLDDLGRRGLVSRALEH